MGKSFFYTKLALSNIKKNRRFTLPFCLSTIGTIMMFYIISSLQMGIDAESTYGGATIVSTMMLGARVISIFAVIFIFYTNSFVIKRRKKELGLYSILGMEKKHITRLIVIETLIISFFSIIVGLLSGIAFSKLMFLILEMLLQTDLTISFVIPIKAITDTLILFLVIFALTMVYNLFQIIAAKPISLLHGDEIGEKEPKSNWLLALVGIAALGVGYYLAVTITNPVAAITFFMLAVVLVIIGTYCLFTSTITVILKALKKNKKFYYKPKNFTTVSGMLYRMKQNAAGLATICILLTCVLVMVGTTISMYISMGDLLDNRYPNDLAVEIYQNPDNLSFDYTPMVEEAIAESAIEAHDNFALEAMTVIVSKEGNHFYDESNNSYHQLKMMTEENFNKYFSRDLSIGDDEVIFWDSEKHDYDTVNLFGKDYKVIYKNEELPSVFIGEDIEMLTEGASLAIVKSYPDIITANYDFAYRYSYYFNTDSDVETQQSFRNILIEKLAADTPNKGYMVEVKALNRNDFIAMYAALFFLGIFLGLVFMMALVLIIYYKQISEGYDDKKRFEIMQKVGMSHKEVKSTIHRQILMVFFIPLVTALIHVSFAMPMLIKILEILLLTNVPLILLSMGAVAAVVAIIYIAVYLQTAKSYYKIVES